MTAGPVTPADIIAFWRNAGPERWFKKNAEFDAEIRAKFSSVHQAAAAGRHQHWETSADGALALLLLLDQFPRNLFRGEPRAFATDAMARAIADRAIARGFDREFGPLRQFFFLPFMHSEALADQTRALELYREAGLADGMKWAQEHADIIRRFGRFPHRNVILGRESSGEEQAFLDRGGFAG
jgi:uncharacterized protein (DUF924 family)